MNKEQQLITMSENNLFLNKLKDEINNCDIKIIDENKESFMYYILLFIVIIFILKYYKLI